MSRLVVHPGWDADMPYLHTFIITLAQLRCNRLEITSIRLDQKYLQAAWRSLDLAMHSTL